MASVNDDDDDNKSVSMTTMKTPYSRWCPLTETQLHSAAQCNLNRRVSLENQWCYRMKTVNMISTLWSCTNIHVRHMVTIIDIGYAGQDKRPAQSVADEPLTSWAHQSQNRLPRMASPSTFWFTSCDELSTRHLRRESLLWLVLLLQTPLRSYYSVCEVVPGMLTAPSLCSTELWWIRLITARIDGGHWPAGYVLSRLLELS